MDLYAKLKAHAYKPTVPYPTKPSKPVPPKNASATELRTTADAMESYEAELAQYEVDRRAYNQLQVDLENEFRADLRAYNGTENYSKEAVLYAKAYSDGHSSGYNEVAIHYENLVEFLGELGVDFSK